jgi:transglutaminase-like putative cysteine protease
MVLAHNIDQEIILSETFTILKYEEIYDYTGEEYIYTQNNSVKILDEVANQIFQSFAYSYHLADVVVEKVSVTIIKPDGTIIELSNPIEDTISSSGNKINKFELKEGNLQKGDIITFHSQTRANPKWNGEFGEYKVIDVNKVYVKNRKLVVKVPANKGFYYKTLNMDIAPLVEKTDQVITYTWEIEDIAPVSPEEDVNRLATILYSSVDSWKKFGNWIKTIFNAEKLQLTAMMKKEVEKLTSTGELEQKMKALYTYVSTNIQFKDPDTDFKSAYIPPSAIETFERKYGDCKAKTVLLMAFLKEIDIAAEPAFLHIKYNFGFDIVLDVFNHVIVYLPELDLFLDPSAETIKYGDLPPTIQGKDVYLPYSNRFLQTPIEPVENRNIIVKQIVLGDEGIENILINQQFTGTYEAYQRELYETETDGAGCYREGWLDKTQNSFPEFNIRYLLVSGANDINEDINVTTSLIRKVKEKPGKTERGFTIRPLCFPLDCPDSNEGTFDEYFKNEDRLYPLDLLLRHNFIRQVEIVLLTEYRKVEIPKAVFIENEVGFLRFETQTVENKVVVEFQLRFNQQMIRPETYKLAKNLVDEAVRIINGERIIVY